MLKPTDPFLAIEFQRPCEENVASLKSFHSFNHAVRYSTVQNDQLVLSLFRRSSRLHLSSQTHNGMFFSLRYPLLLRITTRFPWSFHRSVPFLFPLFLSGIALALVWFWLWLSTSDAFLFSTGVTGSFTTDWLVLYSARRYALEIKSALRVADHAFYWGLALPDVEAVSNAAWWHTALCSGIQFHPDSLNN